MRLGIACLPKGFAFLQARGNPRLHTTQTKQMLTQHQGETNPSVHKVETGKLTPTDPLYWHKAARRRDTRDDHKREGRERKKTSNSPL